MKHDQPIPKSPQGPAPKDATDTQQMAWNLKTDRCKNIYARRKAIVELAFGQIETRQGKHILLRGLEKARKKWDLLAGCHNLLKLFSHRAANA